jgi:hypothetical protein
MQHAGQREVVHVARMTGDLGPALAARNGPTDQLSASSFQVLAPGSVQNGDMPRRPERRLT